MSLSAVFCVSYIGSVCYDSELANDIFSVLGRLVSNKIWKPSYRLFSTLATNCGRRGRLLAISDNDVKVLNSARAHKDKTLGRGWLFVETKVKLMLQLIDSWVGTGEVIGPDVELLLQLVVTLVSHREWRDTELQAFGARCFVGLMHSVETGKLEGLMNRMLIYCSTKRIDS